MNITLDNVFMITGFLLAMYSCVFNDVIQALGTFLSSNKDKPSWLIWLFSSTVLAITLVSGWIINNGDMSFGRLDRIPFPEHFYWWHVVPPIILLFLTKKGIPASTTFLILSIFSSNLLIGMMLTKSIIGYVMAMIIAIIIYTVIARPIEKYFFYNQTTTYSKKWVAAKWLSSAFLWSQWIMQDASHLFVYLPRKASFEQMVLSVFAFVMLLWVVAITRGGEVQKIVKLKTNTQDLRSATIIDMIYGFILMYFIQLNNIPMSTTWVFIGLLAGREIALYNRLRFESPKKMYKHILKDFTKILFGLLISILSVELLTNFSVIKQFFVSHFI